MRTHILRAALFGLAVTLATPVLATPVTLYMKDGVGFGFENVAVAELLANGADLFQTPPPGSFFADPTGTRIGTATSSQNVERNLFMPNRADPAMVTGVFSFTALDRDYEDLFIVVRGHSPLDVTGTFYANPNFGLEVDAMTSPWDVIRPDPIGFPEVFHLIFEIGDLAQNDSANVVMRYRIAQELFVEVADPDSPFPCAQLFDDQCRFPELLIGYAEGLSVPEPGGGVLWTLMVLGVPAVARRFRRG